MKNVKYLLIFLSIVIATITKSSYAENNMKKFKPSSRQFRFTFSYPNKGWLLVEDIKQTRKSRFKDIAVLKTMNRVNQVRISTYKGLKSPNAKQVARLLEAEFIQQELRRGEQYMRVKDKKMTESLIKKAKAKEGWILSISYYDRREGTLYTTYYIFYRKVVLPSNKPGKADLIIGKAYIIRALLREQNYNKVIKDVLKMVNSFEFKLTY